MVAIGDTHVGNEGAIMPEEVNSEDICEGRNRRYFPNKIQKILLGKWYEMCDTYPKPDVLIINGDLVDGKNYKDTGLGTWTTDSLLQAKALSDLVKILKPRKIIATSGSAYHSDRNPNIDRIATELCGGTFKGGYASLKIGNQRIYAQHKVTVSKSSWQYRTTPIARALVLAALQESDFGHYNIVLKSHAHYFTYAGFTNALAMILPCWKAYDQFGDTNIEFNSPAIGYVAFSFNGDDFSFDHHVMHFRQATLNPDMVI
jgi:hypothetical protein